MGGLESKSKRHLNRTLGGEMRCTETRNVGCQCWWERWWVMHSPRLFISATLWIPCTACQTVTLTVFYLKKGGGGRKAGTQAPYITTVPRTVKLKEVNGSFSQKRATERPQLAHVGKRELEHDLPPSQCSVWQRKYGTNKHKITLQQGKEQNQADEWPSLQLTLTPVPLGPSVGTGRKDRPQPEH